MTRNEEIDRLRAVAVIMVIVVHMADYLQFVKLGFPSLNQFLGGMSVGVDLFFVISGFVVSASIFGRIDAAQAQKNDGHIGFAHFLKHFYCRRVFRILPMSWLVLVTTLLILFGLHGWNEETDYALKTSFASFNMVTNYFLYYSPPKHYSVSPFGHYWSLAIEEQFYLIYPAFIYFVSSMRKRFVALGILLGLMVFVIRPWLYDGAIAAGHSRAQFATHFRADGIIAGCMLYILSRTKFFQDLFPLQKPRKGVGLFLSLFFVMTMTSAKVIMPPLFWIPLAVISSCFLVALAAYQQGIIFYLPGTESIFKWIGERSYAIYLVNWPLMWILHECKQRYTSEWNLGSSNFLTFGFLLAWFVLTLAICQLSYKFFEKPLLEYGNGLAKRL